MYTFACVFVLSCFILARWYCCHVLFPLSCIDVTRAVDGDLSPRAPVPCVNGVDDVDVDDAHTPPKGVVVSGSVVEGVGVVVRGVLCESNPASPACVACGETQWSFGGPGDDLIKGLVWSCGGCSAFLPYLPPACPLSIASRDSILSTTPMYCGGECQANHWFESHHRHCRRDDVALYGYVHLATPALHDVIPSSFGRRVERGGVVEHIPYLMRVEMVGGGRHV